MQANSYTQVMAQPIGAVVLSHAPCALTQRRKLRSTRAIVIPALLFFSSRVFLRELCECASECVNCYYLPLSSGVQFQPTAKPLTRAMSKDPFVYTLIDIFFYSTLSSLERLFKECMTSPKRSSSWIWLKVCQSINLTTVVRLL